MRVALAMACVACSAWAHDAVAEEPAHDPMPSAEQRSLTSSQAGISTGKIGQRLPDQSVAGIRKHIDEVFARNKGALHALYERALHDNPRLQGQVSADIDISADGTVSRCSITKSDLQAPELEQKLCARIRLIRFGVFDNPQSVKKSFDFFPAT